MTSSLRIGLAGLGLHGQRYAKHLLQGDVEGACLTAVSRADEAAGRAFADQHGLAYVQDPHELATTPQVDAVVLVLPPHLHPPVSESCLRAGRPVLVEKPMAPDAASGRAVAAAAESSGTPLMVGQTLRFDAVVRRLRAERESIGRLRMMTLNQRFEPSHRSWIDAPGSGGLIINTGVHGFDLLRHLSGAEPVSIAAEVGRGRTKRTEDELVAILRFEPGGLLAVLDNARSTDSRSGRIELVGDDGQLWGDHVHRTFDRCVGTSLEHLGPIARNPTVPATLQAFVDSLRNETPPPIGVADGLATARMIEATTRSATERRTVLLDEV